MKAFLVSALALGALSSVALAEPVELTDAELDSVTAGGFFVAGVSTGTHPGFERTPIPRLLRATDPFVTPAGGGAIVVLGDGDTLSVLGTERRIGFARPTSPGFGAPFTLVIINENVFAPTVAP
jgi:hypothetical protein